MSVGSRMKERRESLGMTQVQLAKLLGVTKGAIGNYETDANFPKTSILYQIFEALKCDANYLFQDEIRERIEYAASPQEMEHLIKKYRLLDEYGKKAVDSVLDIEYQRYTDSIQARQAAQRARAGRQDAQAGRSEIESAAEKLVYLNPRAAGTPLCAESDFERLEFPEDPAPKNKKASLCQY